MLPFCQICLVSPRKKLKFDKIMCIFVTFSLFGITFRFGLLSNLTVKFEILLLIYT